MHRTIRLALTATLAALLAGCGAVNPPHPPNNSDPQALRGKLEALMADTCYLGDPRRLYPHCGEYFTELVSTAGAVDDVLPGKPKPLHDAAALIHQGITNYSTHNCAPADQQPHPADTQPCATALTLVHAGIQQVYAGLYPGNR